LGRKDRVICSLDIGTTKICMLITRVLENDSLEVVSTGYALSSGLKKGVVVDLEEAAAAIRKAADEAEAKSGISVDWVTVGVSGDHIQGFNCHGAASVEGKNNEVTMDDVANVIKAAQAIPVPAEREILHVLAQEFLLDNRGGIQNPVGLTGSRLDVNAHVVTSDTALTQNLINAVNRAQMRVNNVVVQQLASSEAVLTPDEKELGVAVIDIGGGTSDIAVYMKNAIRSSFVLPIGGAHFTRDLSIGLRTPIDDAERIKLNHGTVLVDSLSPDEMIEVPGVATRSPRPLPRKMVCEILKDRAVEALELIKERIGSNADREQLIAGAVFTGGGSLLDGLLALAEEMLEMPVRQGLPQGIHGLTDDLAHPVYATAIGLAMHGALEREGRKSRPSKSNSKPLLLNRFLTWVGN
jgi:cell division protein FtsA